MSKLTIQSTLSIVTLGAPSDPHLHTASRVVVEETSPGRWVGHAVISPLDVGAFATEAEAALAIQAALDRLAFLVGEAYAPPASGPSPEALAFARAMAAGEAAPPMTDADIVALAHKLDGSRAVDVVEVKATPTPVRSSLVEATTTIASAHTGGGPTVPLEHRPVVIEDTGHAPVAPAAVGPLGHPVG